MDELRLNIGENLRKLRVLRGLTLEETAALTGVSKPMLGQIERGRSAPTVTTLWKIATGLKAPLSAFLREARAECEVAVPKPDRLITAEEGAMRAYPLFGYDPVRGVESFYIEFDAGCRHVSERHAAGVEERLFVMRGSLRLDIGEKTLELGPGQAARFRGDLPHAYQNAGAGLCAVYNMIFYLGGMEDV